MLVAAADTGVILVLPSGVPAAAVPSATPEVHQREVAVVRTQQCVPLVDVLVVRLDDEDVDRLDPLLAGL
ncbi:hypothetical protein [Streptomyces sp. Ncost-T10-10d]|uniref:hypothetical protein n=1 Tax=Streptomyces sp. Ncost-T10-10d TaxID=1839774 RepID=UPI000B85E178|nr:hypothetical protein [Streptomyces sp. Ncost-T10-10d]